MTMLVRLDDVLEFLAKRRIRATFKAVGEAVGVTIEPFATHIHSGLSSRERGGSCTPRRASHLRRSTVADRPARNGSRPEQTSCGGCAPASWTETLPTFPTAHPTEPPEATARRLGRRHRAAGRAVPGSLRSSQIRPVVHRSRTVGTRSATVA